MTDIPDDAPLRLKDAIKIAFPAGGMTVSGLRREHANGRLEFEMIASKQFVTLHAIREMRERCKVAPQPVRLSLKSESPVPPTVSSKDVLSAKLRSLRETIKKEERERKRREGYRVLRRD